MKKGLLYVGMMVVAMGFATSNVMAEDVPTADEAVTYELPEMKLLGVVGDAPALTFVTPTIMGDTITRVFSRGSWLNYTSIVDGVKTNKIQVKITGTVPDGTNLKVLAAPAATGDGTKGTQGELLTLSADDQTLITGIGSCYTGTGVNSGAQLIYTWSVNTAVGSYTALRSNAVASDIEVIYTISAGAE